MRKTTKIGIIGSGRNAIRHALSYKQMPDVELVAVADIVPERAKEFIEAQQLTGAKAFESAEKMLELDLDGVSVCTPNVAHHSASIMALEAGKHVLVEKPMAVTLQQAVAMAAAEKKSGKILTIGFQPRYDPNIQEIKRIVQSGALGEIYYIQTGGGRRRGMPGGSFIRKDIAGAGAIVDIGCYALDLVLDAVGYPKPVSVSAYTSNFFGIDPIHHQEAGNFEVEDFGVALVRFENGLALNFKISWAMHMDTLGPTLFLGKEGGLKVEPSAKGNPRFNGVWDGGVGSITYYHDTLGHHTHTEIPLKIHDTNIFYEKIRDFIVAIQEGKGAPIPSYQMVINQAIIDGMLRSAEAKREVEVSIEEN